MLQKQSYTVEDDDIEGGESAKRKTNFTGYFMKHVKDRKVLMQFLRLTVSLFVSLS
jgi:hypothetical protein